MSVASSVFAQTSGLTQRVPNTTLQMPASPPVYGYQTTNAFGPLTFVYPTAIAVPPGETNRLFVTEQPGGIVVITNLAAPTRTFFLLISRGIMGGMPPDERGVLGLAFHPGYATNRYFFVFYSTSLNASNFFTSRLYERLSRFQTSADNPNYADPNSEVILINQLDLAANHNGGDLHFGPDGYVVPDVRPLPL